MGYESTLHLIDVKIKSRSVAVVKRALRFRWRPGTIRIRQFLDHMVIDSAGFLAFKASKDGFDPYVPDSEDGTVPALYGKWYEAERFAGWLKSHSESGGRLILHSLEADGHAWGWEFDGKGRMRAMDLVPVASWA